MSDNPTPPKPDTIAGALIATINSVFPVLLLTGAVNLSDAAIGAIMLVVTNVVTLGGYLFARSK